MNTASSTTSRGAPSPIQPGVTEGGVVLDQNNTYPIMAGGCHVVMTAACSFNRFKIKKKITTHKGTAQDYV